MNIESIKEAVNADNLSNLQKEWVILQILSEDENVIPQMLNILQTERQRNKELLIDTNLELSRAFVKLEYPEIGGKDNPTFITDCIRAHFLKWKDYIHCCFKMDGLP